jgi:hypothetical protein
MGVLSKFQCSKLIGIICSNGDVSKNAESELSKESSHNIVMCRIKDICKCVSDSYVEYYK